jgi:hypothetical protein
VIVRIQLGFIESGLDVEPALAPAAAKRFAAQRFHYRIQQALTK